MSLRTIKRSMRASSIAVLALAAGLASAPAPAQAGDDHRRWVGLVIGAAAGGLAGSRIGKGSGRLWATGAGAAIGGIIGASVGRDLDEAARIRDNIELQRTLEGAPPDRARMWRGERHGDFGRARPGNTRQIAGRMCRDFERTTRRSGRSWSDSGVACRTADGVWELMEAPAR